LRGYDYSQPGAYFVTICTQNWACLFGEIVQGQLTPNDAGKIVRDRWRRLADRFRGVSLDEFVVMPNHVHGIILLDGSHPDDTHRLPSVDLARMVQWFKTGTTYDYIEGVRTKSWIPFDRRLCQRNYYEHNVRNDVEYVRIAAYIEANPSRWQDDALHPSSPGFQPKRSS
jgi:putative transposase